MKTKNLILICLALFSALHLQAQGTTRVSELETWQFRKGHDLNAGEGWEEVRIPHDWAISGPFDRANDLQNVAVVQNGEQTASWKTGRSGGLPWMGKGAYRTVISLDDTEGRTFRLLFDGAMSEAQVLVNGEEAGRWPYGYNAFCFDITGLVHKGENEIAVLLENREETSRWYPGAGLYRKVRLLESGKIRAAVWGSCVRCSSISKESADIEVITEVEGLAVGEAVTLQTSIYGPDGALVGSAVDTRLIQEGIALSQHITVNGPELWSPDSPTLYKAQTRILSGAQVHTEWGHWPKRGKISSSPGDVQEDCCEVVFGIRKLELRPGKGMFLNGERTMFKGVCLHHDLGPLGAAVNRSALRHNLSMLKHMGYNAIRTSHNMPAEDLVELCDSMGFMLMVEPFDEWDVPKCRNGYHRFFNEWAEKDMVNMIRHFRNNASVVMWSIGNEVPSQWAEGGRETAMFLQDICHRLDPTRPVTCGMDQFDAVMNNGFAAALDVAGFNYKTDRYLQAFPLLPQGLILGSETASTVSSRGIYHFPVVSGHDIMHPDHQSSSYDMEHCLWSNIPDWDFAADEDWPWMLGQFVWTGFDYLGEPSPYDTDAWPNHSSVFGIIDLASIPKDRYWLYRSIWNRESPTLHVLPHWTWPGREGQQTPVYVYTSYPSAELFINGKSQGRRSKAGSEGHGIADRGTLCAERFRLMWNDVKYEAGELRAVAYDEEGNAVMEKRIYTAGKPYALQLEIDRDTLRPDGKDLCYATVSVVDRKGNPVPVDTREVRIKVEGQASFEAVANGDPCCLESFREPHMHLFSGKLTCIVRSGETAGQATIKVEARGLKSATATITLK